MKFFVQSMIVSAFLVLGACAPENGGNNRTPVAAPPYPAPNGACGAYPYNGQQLGGQPMPAPNGGYYGGGYNSGGYYGNGYGTGGYPAGTNCVGGAQPMPAPNGGYYGGGYAYGNQYYGNQQYNGNPYYGNQYYGYPNAGAGFYIQGQARWGY